MTEQSTERMTDADKIYAVPAEWAVGHAARPLDVVAHFVPIPGEVDFRRW